MIIHHNMLIIRSCCKISLTYNERGIHHTQRAYLCLIRKAHSVFVGLYSTAVKHGPTCILRVSYLTSSEKKDIIITRQKHYFGYLVDQILLFCFCYVIVIYAYKVWTFCLTTMTTPQQIRCTELGKHCAKWIPVVLTDAIPHTNVSDTSVPCEN